MLKQRRGTRQPRTQAGSGGDSELNASLASRERYTLSQRYQSEANGYNGVANQEVKDDLEEESMRIETHRAEDERRMRLDRESYRGSRILAWSSDRNERDNYDEADHSGRFSHGTLNTTQRPAPFRDDSYSSSPDYTDSEPDFYYDSKPDDYYPLPDGLKGRIAVGREKAVQEAIEGKAAASDDAQGENERLWRAGNPEWPRAQLREISSFRMLNNKDTISRDSTTGNEARMDDLLACVGKRMVKTPFLKEHRDESSDDEEEFEESFMGNRYRVPKIPGQWSPRRRLVPTAPESDEEDEYERYVRERNARSSPRPA